MDLDRNFYIFEVLEVGCLQTAPNQSLNLTGKIVRFYVEGCASSKVIRPAG
jgi:hypothetical protein